MSQWARAPRGFNLVACLVLAGTIGCGAHSDAPPSGRAPLAPMREIDLTPGDAVRELPLKEVRNGRDLGGLSGSRADIPPDHFFRTATLSHATDGDKKVLLAHGVKLDIDLRTYWEVVAAPDALAHDPRFHYEHISLMGVGLYDLVMYSSAERGDLYVHALDEHQGEFRKVFHELANVKDGAVVFHCTSGKDRTGLVAALLLSLAGVDHETIVHNYVISAHYLHPTAEREALARAITESPPEAIEQFLRVLDDRYRGARSYLKLIGVSDDDVSALITRLGQADQKSSDP